MKESILAIENPYFSTNIDYFKNFVRSVHPAIIKIMPNTLSITPAVSPALGNFALISDVSLLGSVT